MKKETTLRRQLFVLLGLTEKEAVLYDTLLSHGQMAAAALEKISGLKKNTYVLLKRLELRGLVQKVIKEGKSHYTPGPPSKLLLFAKEQEKKLQETKSLLVETLPTLEREYHERVGRPVVQYYSGLGGLRAVFDEVYAGGKSEVLSCVGNEAPDPQFYEEIVKKYKPMRVRNGIVAKTISPDSPRARELKATEKQDLKVKFLVDPEKYPMPAEFDSWGNKVALMSFARGDFSAILIEHPDLAKTMQSLLQLAMDGAIQAELNTQAE